MPVSVRLDAKTERLIERIARKRGETKSSVIRRAVDDLAGREEGSLRGKTPYETAADLVGCAHGGPPDLSRRTGEKFKKAILERRRGRR
ncbi:MAG: ribbon-helix-helix protein, CopG family [Nitrospirae bacterium]|nr:ribbon-helix-helix protein, CopG family [Nitrospirota bacterium]MBI3392404.1 ribbon-helix-helix protein, CopG family [Nitrospirota bacterium]